MKKEIPVKIDHVGIFSNNLHPAEVMFKLGFSGEGGCTQLKLDEENQPPRCMRFVFDNCYLEFAINRTESTILSLPARILLKREIMLLHKVSRLLI